MRVFIIQLCRMGDILQTTPMLRGLRRRYPDVEITMVVHDSFEHVPVPRRLVDRLVPFPTATIVSALSDPTADWRNAAETLREFVRGLGSEPYDLTLNLSHSDLSGLLAALVPSREVRGGLVAPDRTRVVAGAWMTYFWASQTSRAQGCFNLVDLYCWMAGVRSDGHGLEIEVSPEATRRMAAWLEREGLTDRPLIAVQLGASEERKRWPAERFAAAADALDPALGAVVLVGSPAERELAACARARARRTLHDAVGETSLPELAALLARSTLLVTNDTGTMHVASAVGTRVVAISTGPVFVHETGPYGEGHLVLESRLECFPCASGARCLHLSCRDSFDPDGVAALARHALDAGPLPRPADARILAGQFTETGRLAYRTVWPSVAELPEMLRQASAQVWEATLPPPGDDGWRLPRPVFQEGEHHGLDPMIAAVRRLGVEVAAVARLARRLVSGAPGEWDAVAGEIRRRLLGLQILGQTTPVCQPVCAYLKVRLDSIVEQDMASVARIYAEECDAARDRAERLAGLLVQRHALTQAVAISGV